MEDNTSRNEFDYGDVDTVTADQLTKRYKQQDKGFEMDEKTGKVKSISKLFAALQWFKKEFGEKNQDTDKIRGFDLISSIKGDYIQDYSHSYKNEKDGYYASRKDIVKFNICWVVKVTFVSVFGVEDVRYYYVIFRRTFFNKWANTYYENAKKYFSHDGITIKIDIVNHTLPPVNKQDICGISTLVLVTGDTEIYYTPMEDVLYLANSKLGIFTDKYNQICVGIPKDYMKLEDVNKY